MKKGGFLERCMLATLPAIAALLMRVIHRLNRCEILDEERVAALRGAREERETRGRDREDGGRG
jgi:hypothetical protein